MATDAPDGNINAHVVRSRRPDHVAPKAAKVKTHQPAPKAAAPAPAEPVKAEALPTPTPAKTPAKKSAAQPKK